MGNLFKSELYKLSRDRSFLVLFLLLFVLSFVYPVYRVYDHYLDGELQETGIQTFLAIMGGLPWIMKFAICFLAGFFVSGEYTTGVMKRTASSGSSRTRIYAAKLAAFSIGSIVISLIFPILATIVTSLINGFGELPDLSAFGYIVRTCGLALLYAAAYSSLLMLFAKLLPDTGKMIAVAVLFLILIDSVFGFISKWIPAIETFYRHSIFPGIYTMGDPQMGAGEPLTHVLVTVLWFVCLGAIGIWVFRRKEIK